MRRQWSLTLVWIALLFAAPASVASAQLQLAPGPPPEASWPRFQCEQGACPTGVGALLTFRAGGEVGFCTATLVGGDRIVTAAHCIESDAASSMHFFLPDEHAITIAWRAVIGVVHAEPRERGADHALLRLDRAIDAPSARLRRAEPVPDGTLTMVRASAHSDRTVFVRSERCLVMPQALSAGRMVPSSIVRVAGCTILPGNSGAPLLDAAGRVVAVVSTAIAPAGVAVLLAPWLAGPAPFVGTISSLACLPRALAPGAPPSSCGSLSRTPDHGLLSSAEARDAAVDAQREALAERLIAWDHALEDDGVGWDLERRIHGLRTYGLPVPGCIELDVLRRARRIDARGRFRITLVVPLWEAIAFLGSDVRMVPLTQRVRDVRMVVRGRIDESGESASIRVRTRGATVSRLRARAQLPVCPEPAEE